MLASSLKAFVMLANLLVAAPVKKARVALQAVQCAGRMHPPQSCTIFGTRCIRAHPRRRDRSCQKISF